MFLDKQLSGDSQGSSSEMYRNTAVQPGVDEIHIEIVGQNAPSDVSDHVQDLSLHQYYTGALNEESSTPQQFKCSYCNKTCLCFKALYVHACIDHKEFVCDSVECFICHQLFAFTQDYHNHLSYDHNFKNPNVICDVCLKVLPDCDSLQAHKLNHQDYSCQSCSKKFFSQHHLFLHHHYHNCLGKLLCDICGIPFHSKLLQGLHSLRHKHIECPVAKNESCTSIITDIDLIDHFKKDHSNEEITLLLKSIENYDSEEKSLDELTSQTILPDGSKLHYIDRGLDFKTWLSEIKLKQDEECKTCSAKYTSIFQLWIHYLKRHLNDNKCPVCEKQFNSITNTLLHLGSQNCQLNQNTVTALICPQCNETFEKRECLLQHQLSHVKPLQCPECSASFAKKLELKRHMQEHGLPLQSPKPVFQCPVCSTKWPCMTNLRRHIRTHANEKPHQCEQCGATFKRQQALKAHYTNAHSSESHPCPHCINVCRTKQALFLHVCRVHVGLRRFICGLCAKPWPQNQDLRRHLSKSHNVDFPPLTKSSTASSKMVHVIPPIENLSPEDSLREKIAQVIAEEKDKLKCLYSELGADPSTIEGNISETVSNTKSDLPSTGIEPPTQDKIYLSCDFCNFRCEDLTTWVEHTVSHQQMTLNNQTTNPVNFVSLPIVPVQPIILSPVVPINYSTLLTVVPTPTQTVNLNSTVIQQPVILRQPLDNLGLPPGENISREGMKKTEEKRDDSENTEELLNINGMFVRIERRDGDEAAELISKSAGQTISLESATFESTDGIIENRSNEKLTVTEDAVEEEVSVPSEDDNTSEDDNDGIEDIVEQLSNCVKASQNDPDGPEQLARSLNLRCSDDITGTSCPQCGKVLCSSKSLQRHLQTHSGEKPFSCEVCDKAFSAKHNLKIHMMSHTQERPHTCPFCGKKMRYLKEFVEHKKKHQGIKDYSCTICGRSFVRKRELVRHQRSHSSEKKYQCSICLKFFSRLDYLKQVHMPQTHGQYCCTICKKRFQYEDKLKEHEIKHTLPAPYKKRVSCPICDKSFARNAGLKTHLELHKNSKANVVCYACPRKFCSVEKMLTHLGHFHKKWRDDIAEQNRRIVENCRVSIQTETPSGEIVTENIDGVYKVDAVKSSIVSPQ